MHENFLDEGALAIDSFQLLWCNIFTLSQLEDIFCSVNNFDGAIRKHHSHVTSLQPALFESGLSLLVVFVVAGCN